MQLLFTIVLTLASVIPAFGQLEKQTDKEINKGTPDSYLFSGKHNMVKKLHLAPINKIDYTFYCRMWIDEQVFEIWTNDYKTFQGNITNYTASYEKRNERNGRKKPSRYFSNIVMMDTSVAHKTYDLLLPIESITAEDSINEWSRIVYFVETLKEGNYCYKKYWTQYVQDSSLIEANLIERFVTQLNQLHNSDSINREFYKRLKPGKYTDGSMIIIKYSKKQDRKLRKEFPSRSYLDSISDSLNKYLCENLSHILFPDGIPYTTDSYIFHLRLSPENKITGIKSEGDYYSLADRIDDLKMKRKVRKAFKQIDLSFVRSEIPYEKTFHYFQGGIYIY